MGTDCLWASFRGNGSVLKLDSGNVLTNCDYIKNLYTVHFESMNFMVCELYLIKQNNKQWKRLTSGPSFLILG